MLCYPLTCKEQTDKSRRWTLSRLGRHWGLHRVLLAGRHVNKRSIGSSKIATGSVTSQPLHHRSGGCALAQTVSKENQTE